METISEKILNFLKKHPKKHFNNRQLSVALGIPQASVRRVTYQLSEQHMVEDLGGPPYRMRHK